MDLSQTALTDNEWTLSYDVTDTGVSVYLTKGKKLIQALFKPIARKELDGLVRKFRDPLEVTEANDPSETGVLRPGIRQETVGFASFRHTS